MHESYAFHASCLNFYLFLPLQLSVLLSKWVRVLDAFLDDENGSHHSE